MYNPKAEVTDLYTGASAVGYLRVILLQSERAGKRWYGIYHK